MPLAVTEWRPSYKRGTLMQASLALIGSVAALLAWWLQGSAGWLIGGSLFLLVVPLTLIVILPTNSRLESQDLDIRSEKRDGYCGGGATFMRFARFLAE